MFRKRFLTNTALRNIVKLIRSNRQSHLSKLTLFCSSAKLKILPELISERNCGLKGHFKVTGIGVLARNLGCRSQSLNKTCLAMDKTKLMAQKATLSDRFISRIKNNPIAATVIVLATILIAFAAFTDAVNKILHLIPTKRPGVARTELNRLSLEYTADVFVEAAAKGDIHAVKLFLAAGMDPNVKNGRGATAVSAAVRGGHVQIVKELATRKPIFDGHDLSRAAVRQNGEILRILLDIGADTELKNEAFVSAAATGRFEHMRTLLESGADVSSVGAEALMRAAGSQFNRDKVSEIGQHDIVKFLLDLGVDVNTKNVDGSTPLHYATRSGFVAVIETLLSRGARINAKNNAGWTALFMALYRHAFNIVEYPPKEKVEQIVEILLANGAEGNVKDSQGKTPLMIAANFCSAKVVRMLLDAGSKAGQQDDRGRTALSFVKYNSHRREHGEIIHLLRAAESSAADIEEKDGA
jgi:ankyrin repeat protein